MGQPASWLADTALFPLPFSPSQEAGFHVVTVSPRAEMLETGSTCPSCAPTASDAIPLVHARSHGYLWGPSPSAEKVAALESLVWLHISVTRGAVRTAHTETSSPVNQLDLRGGRAKRQLSGWF